MANELLKILAQSSAENHPFSSERFNSIVNEIEKQDVPAHLKTDNLVGPPEAFVAFVRQWVENLAGIYAAEELTADFRQQIARLVQKHPGCGEWVPAWIRRLLIHLESALNSSQYLSAWENLQTAQAYVDLCVQSHTLKTSAGPLAKAVVDDFQRTLAAIEGEEDFIDFEVLERKLKQLFEHWAKHSAGESPLFHELEFLRLFAEQILPLHEGSGTFWTVLLSLKLAPAVQARIATSPQHILADVLDHLAAANGNFFVLTNLRAEVADQLPGWEEADADVLDLLTAIMLVRYDIRQDTPLKTRLLLLVQREGLADALATGIQRWAKYKGRVVEWLRLRFERNYVDWFEDNLNFLGRLVADGVEQEAAMQRARPLLSKYGEELAVGVKGQNMALRMTSLLREVLDLALWSAATTRSAKFAGLRFRRGLVANLGFDLTEEVWKKTPRAQAILLMVLTDANITGAHVPVAKSLLQTLEVVARSVRFSLLDYRFDAAKLAKLDLAALELAPEDITLTWRRLLAEAKLSPESAYLEQAQAWFSDSILSRLGTIEGARLVSLLERASGLLVSVRDGEVVPERLTKLLDAFIEDLPRLTASLNLRKQANSLAKEAVEQVSERSDGFRRQGAQGRLLLTLENELCFYQTARVLYPGSRLSPRDFSAWWSRVINAPGIPRASDVAEANLHSVFHVLSRRLSAEETDRSFAALHDTYKEWLQVTCPEATLGTRTLPYEGPLWRATLGAATTPLPASCALQADELTKAAQPLGKLRDTVTKHVQAFASAMLATGDAEAAWARVAALQATALEAGGTAELARAYHGFGFTLAENLSGARASLWQNWLAQGVRQLAQVGLAQRLTPKLPEILAFIEAEARKHAGGAPVGEVAAQVLPVWLDLLRTQSLAWATLNVGRVLLEQHAARTNLTAEQAQLPFALCCVWAIDALDPVERHALVEATAAAETATRPLSSWRALGEHVFGNPDYVFSAKPEEERALRAMLSGVAVAAAHPCRATRPVLIARVLLASELPRYRKADALADSPSEMASTVASHLPAGVAEALTAAGQRLVPLLEIRSAPQRLALATAHLAGLAPLHGVGPFLAAPEAELSAALETMAAARQPLEVDWAPWRALLGEPWKNSTETDLTRRRFNQMLLSATVHQVAGGASPNRAAYLGLRQAGLLLGLSGYLDSIGHDFRFLASLLPTSGPAQSALRAALDLAPALSLGARLLAGVTPLANALANEVDKPESTFLPSGGLGCGESLPTPRLYGSLLQTVGHSALLLAEAPPTLPVALAAPQSPAAALRWANLRRAVARITQGAEVVWLAQLTPAEERSPTSSPAWLMAAAPTTPTWLAALRPALQQAVATAAPIACEHVAEPSQAEAVRWAVQASLGEVTDALGRSGDAEAALVAVGPGLLADVAHFGPDLLLETAGLTARESLSGGRVALVPLSYHACQGFGRAVVAHAIGLLLHRHAEGAATEAVTRWWESLTAEAKGGWDGAEPLAKARLAAEVACLLHAQAVALRSSPWSGAVLTIGQRWLTQLLPLARTAQPWAGLVRALEDALLPKASFAERSALLRLTEQWRLLAQNLGGATVLARATFGPASDLTLATETVPEAATRAQFSAILVAALTPDHAPCGGKALWQRAFVSHASLAQLEAGSVRTWASELLAKATKASGNQVPPGLTRRLGELPRMVEVAAEASTLGAALPCGLGAAVLSAAPEARPLWLAGVLARTDPATGLVTPDVADLPLGSAMGWNAPDATTLVARLKTCEAVWTVRDAWDTGTPTAPAPEPPKAASAAPAPTPAPAAAAAPASGGGGLFGMFGGKAKTAGPAPAAIEKAQTRVPFAPRPSPAAAFVESWKQEVGLAVRDLVVRQATEMPVEALALLASVPVVGRHHSPEREEALVAFFEAIGKHNAAKLGGEGSPAAQALALVISKAALLSLGLTLLTNEAPLAAKVGNLVGGKAEAAHGLVRLVALLALGWRTSEAAEFYLGGAWASAAPSLDVFRNNVRDGLPKVAWSRLDEVWASAKVPQGG